MRNEFFPILLIIKLGERDYEERLCLRFPSFFFESNIAGITRQPSIDFTTIVFDNPSGL